MLEALKKQVEKEIAGQSFGTQPKSLYEPIRYLMKLGGKRMRPLLVLMAYSLYKKDAEKIISYATAVEAFHNFTLMHDDIMDKAPLRRGKATVHEKWNVNTAILSGDVMLVRVYDMFLSLPDHQLKKVLRAFNQCAVEVCEGQQWDMEFETKAKNKYGRRMSPPVKKILIGKTAEYINEQISDVPDPALLNDWKYFGSQNTDHAMAFGMCLLFADEHYSIDGVHMSDQEEEPESSLITYKKINGQIVAILG